MPTYRVDRECTGFNGTQSFKVVADTPEEAVEKFNNGVDEFIEEELEVTNLAKVELSHIYQI